VRLRRYIQRRVRQRMENFMELEKSFPRRTWWTYAFAKEWAILLRYLQ